MDGGPLPMWAVAMSVSSARLASTSFAVVAFALIALHLLLR